MAEYFPLGRGESMSEGEYQRQYDLCDQVDVGDLGDDHFVPPSLGEKAGFWRTKNGAVLVIADMTKAHLDNAIKLFTRAGWGDHTKIRELREERARR